MRMVLFFLVFFLTGSLLIIGAAIYLITYITKRNNKSGYQYVMRTGFPAWAIVKSVSRTNDLKGANSIFTVNLVLHKPEGEMEETSQRIVIPDAELTTFGEGSVLETRFVCDQAKLIVAIVGYPFCKTN